MKTRDITDICIASSQDHLWIAVSAGRTTLIGQQDGHSVAVHTASSMKRGRSLARHLLWMINSLR